MALLVVVCVGAGGLVGAPARFVLDRMVAEHARSEFPWGTVLVNISGSFLFGLLTGIDLAVHLPTAAKALSGTGFCGAYTTFSTWSFETLRLLEKNELVKAAVNAVMSLAIGLLAAAGGIALGLVH